MRHFRFPTMRNGVSGRQVVSCSSAGGPRPCRFAAGFTLVELVVALSLLGIALAIAAPAVRGWSDNANLKAAAREISSDCYQMRQRSMAENVRFRVVFNPDPTNTYTLQQETAPGSSLYNAILTKTFADFPRITMTGAVIGGGTTATFQSRGSSSAGTISLSNSRGSTATITLLMTGRVHVTYSMQ